MSITATPPTGSYASPVISSVSTLASPAVSSTIIMTPPASPVAKRVRLSSGGVHARHAYEFGECLGKGTAGEVHRVKHLSSRKTYAIKTVFQEDEDTKKWIEREVACLKRLANENCPNIVRMYSHFEDPLKNATCMVLSHHSMSLYAYIREIPLAIRQQAAPFILKDICNALSVCHRNNILHRDVRPMNILVDRTSGFAVLADFSHASDPQHTDTVYNVKTNMQCPVERTDSLQAIAYRAPEMAWYDPLYGPPVDMWSLGVILCDLHEPRPTHDSCLFSGLTNGSTITSVHYNEQQLLRKQLDVCLDPMGADFENRQWTLFIIEKFPRLQTQLEKEFRRHQNRDYWFRHSTKQTYMIEPALKKCVRGLLTITPSKRWTTERCLDTLNKAIKVYFIF